MNWHLSLSQFLLQAAVGGTVLLGLAYLVSSLRRQPPVLRIRVIEYALLGCLFLPILAQLPFLPHLFVGVIGNSSPTATSNDGISEDPLLETVTDRSKEFLAVLPPIDTNAEGEDNTPAIAATNTMPSESMNAASEVVSPEVKPSRGAGIDSAVLWQRVSFVVVVGWMAISLFLLARWIRGWLAVRRLMRNSVAVSPRVHHLFAEITGNGTRSTKLVMSPEIEHPLTFGWFAPVIVLPLSACEAANESELRFGLAHEWSHVERRDIRRWHLASLVKFFFFWQPLFWRLREQLRLAQDVVADALAVQQGREPEDYAEYLVRVAKRSHGLPLEVALGVGDKPSQLYRRVTMLIQETPRPRSLSRFWGAAVTMLAIFVIGSLATLRLDAEEKQESKKEMPAKEKAKDKNKDKKEPELPKAEKLTYTGLVTSVGDRKPIEGATVTVRRSISGSIKFNEKEGLVEETKHKTGKDGKYTFTIPPEQSGIYSLYIELDVSAPGYASQTGFGYSLTMIRQNETTGERPFFEDIRLRPAKEVTGLVETPEGKPAKGVRVLSFATKPGGPFGSGEDEGDSHFGSFDETFTDENGKFSLWAITPGEFVFWILPKEYSPSIHAPKKNQRGDLGKFTLQEGIRLKGKAVDTDGKPIPNIYVTADNAIPSELINGLAVADSINRGTQTNDKGEFEFLPLPVGTYTVTAVERNHEASDSHRKRTEKIPLQHVFIAQKIKIKEGEKPDPIEIRAHPFVVLEVQFKNAKGEPSGGHAPHFVGQLDGQFWFNEMKAEKGGKMTLKVPHGIESAQLNFIDNEHNSLRFRKSKDDPLTHGYSLDLGTLDRDVKTIEAIRYTAPTVIVKVVGKDGDKIDPKSVGITGWYTANPLERGITRSSKGRQSEMSFNRQDDGRFRSEQMLPDEETTITAFLEGYKDTVVKISLKEGETKEIEMILEKK